jgi:formylglycine-generating enzyme required for sulfatase activity
LHKLPLQLAIQLKYDLLPSSEHDDSPQHQGNFPVASRANPRGLDWSFGPSEPAEKKRVHRGGSFLYTDQYRSRYMVGTRGKGGGSAGTNHVGFRLAKAR